MLPDEFSPESASALNSFCREVLWVILLGIARADCCLCLSAQPGGYPVRQKQSQ